MPLTAATRLEIRDFLLQEVTRYITENLANLPALEAQPFHARLMPALFGTALSERSFSTRLGLWFQRIALLVARQFNQQAEMNYLVTGQLQPAAEAQITAIIAQMDGPPPKRIPNRCLDTTQVIGLQYQGGTARQVRSDLFILRPDQSRVYFEMKTVKPNKNTFRDMKRDILIIMAMEYQSNAQAYAAMSYNPTGEGNAYVPDYNEFLELGTDLMVGRPFWTFIGDAQTYDELLEIAQEVGALTTPLVTAANQQNQQE